MGSNNVKFSTFANNIVFKILVSIGLSVIALDSFVSHNNTILTLGITLFTLGFTIPISLYFQTKQNNDTFEIINACHNYGIENIYEGRKYNKSYKRMRDRIDSALGNTRNLRLIGVAFPELLDPETGSDSSAKRCLKDTNVNIELIVLNPDSPAAKRRANIEDPDHMCNEGETICNIRNTIMNHTKLLIRARLENKYGNKWKDILSKMYKSMNDVDMYHRIINDIKMRIRITDFDPISFIIATDDTLFSEQYSFGRPESMETTSTCIGGYLPVVQYKKSSNGYDFLLSHFDYIWNSDMTTEITISHIEFIVKAIGCQIAQPITAADPLNFGGVTG